jgi:hypothetical protein
MKEYSLSLESFWVQGICACAGRRERGTHRDRQGDQPVMFKVQSIYKEAGVK